MQGATNQILEFNMETETWIQGLAGGMIKIRDKHAVSNIMLKTPSKYCNNQVCHNNVQGSRSQIDIPKEVTLFSPPLVPRGHGVT